MTSEIAVLNQKAVALAADSAVTLVDGGLVAVRNDQRKLFNLVDGKPIALMFFGVADVMGHPWDVLIENYQKKTKSSDFAHVADYAASFLGSLDNLEELFPRDRQRDEYKRLLASVFRYLFQFAQYLRDNAEGETARATDAAILEIAIEHIWRGYQTREDGTARADLACFPKDFGKKVAADYAQQIEETIAYGFGPFALGKQSQQRLREIAVYCVVKDLFLEDVTGLVFSGFGARIVILRRHLLHVRDRRRNCQTRRADSRCHRRRYPFAHPRIRRQRSHQRVHPRHRFQSRAPGSRRVPCDAAWARRSARRSIAVAGCQRARKCARTFPEGFRAAQYFDAFHRMIADYQQQAFINPILRVLEIAARNELAETARDLVGLNVFKKRITAQKQTVGGAIDVAVISREGGFQWWSKQGGN